MSVRISVPQLTVRQPLCVASYVGGLKIYCNTLAVTEGLPRGGY